MVLQAAITHCLNVGGAYTLTRLRLGTIARACKTVDEMVNELLPRVAKCALSTMDKRHKFVVEESNFSIPHPRKRRFYQTD